MFGSQLVDYLGRIRRCSLVEEVYHWGWALKCQKPMTGTRVCVSFCFSLCVCLSPSFLWLRYKLSTMAPAPCLPVYRHA